MLPAVVSVRSSLAGQAPATSPTAPAGSREGQELHPAEVRRRTAGLVKRSGELGHRMRRNDACRVVMAWAEASDCSADGWNTWLAHSFDPTQAAALANVSLGGGPDAA